MAIVTADRAGGRTADPRPRGSAPRRVGVRILGKHPLGWLFSAPYLIFVLLIFAYPLILAGYMSFHDYFFAAPGVKVDRPFVGLENYLTVFTDPAVRRSFVNVGIFLIINVPLTVVISLVLATLLNRVTRLKTFLRVAFYVPYVTASVAVVGVWLFLFSGEGLVNTVLGPLAPDPTWLISPTWAMPSIAFFVTWKGMGLQIPPQRHRHHYVRASVRVHEYPDGRLAIFDGPSCLARFDPKGKPIDASLAA